MKINRISADIAPGLIHCNLNMSRMALNKVTILNVVAREFDVYVSTIISPTIQRKATVPRQVAHMFCMLIPGYTKSQTGQEVGGRDRTTVIHSLKTVVAVYDTSPRFRDQLNSIRDRLSVSDKVFQEHLNKWRR